MKQVYLLYGEPVSEAVAIAMITDHTSATNYEDYCDLVADGDTAALKLDKALERRILVGVEWTADNSPIMGDRVPIGGLITYDVLMLYGAHNIDKLGQYFQCGEGLRIASGATIATTFRKVGDYYELLGDCLLGTTIRHDTIQHDGKALAWDSLLIGEDMGGAGAMVYAVSCGKVTPCDELRYHHHTAKGGECWQYNKVGGWEVRP